jgi:diamine N-acetyltransferase
LAVGGGATPPTALVPVDSSNREAVLAARVREDQVQLVASNAKSLRQAEEDDSLVPRAFLEGGEVVGFAMYQRREDGSAYIWRVMLDRRHQGRGLGRRLMQMLIDEIRAVGATHVFISHRPYNPPAESLFSSLGFLEYDLEPDGEVVRLLDWRPDRPPPV